MLTIAISLMDQTLTPNPVYIFNKNYPSQRWNMSLIISPLRKDVTTRANMDTQFIKGISNYA